MHKNIYHFRDQFILPNKSVLQWFPGHMGKGMKQIKQQLKNVDCLIEVHDARIPISGRNKNFTSFSEVKPNILIFNKKDLADLRKFEHLKGKLDVCSSKVIFTNCKDQNCPGVKKIIPLATEILCNSQRYHRSENEDFSMMIIGVPNVGKSSLINILRNRYLNKRNAAPVGAIAGITRSVMTRIKVCQKPLIYLLDTPGILSPKIEKLEEGLKLALLSTMQDHLVGSQIIADYLLYWLNKNRKFRYVELLGLKEPSDNIIEVLSQVAVNFNKTMRRRSMETLQIEVTLDLNTAADYFINSFRKGELGKVMLDSVNDIN